MKTYIIHVSDAFEREKHIKRELNRTELEVEFVNEGDKTDLSEEIIGNYFSGEMADITNASRISCAYKHILSYEKIANANLKYALILEDDILFYRNFNKQLNRIEKEIEKLKLTNFFISLEDSNLKYVKGSERVKNKILYPKPKGRLAGAYLIDIEASKNILAYIKTNTCSLPIDWFHNLCAENKIMQIFWTHPTIATQGSLTGVLKTLIDNKKSGLFRILSYKIQKVYKKLLYSLR